MSNEINKDFVNELISHVMENAILALRCFISDDEATIVTTSNQAKIQDRKIKVTTIIEGDQ